MGSEDRTAGRTAPVRTGSAAIGLAVLCVFLAALVSLAASGQRLTGRVVKVADGDTFVLATSGSVVEVRVFGIDCPEIHQPYGGSAKQFTVERIADRTVEVIPVTTDRYGRLVGRVRAGGQDLSLLLLQAGLAWHLTEYSSDEAFASAERHARAWRKGLWAQRNPVPPWVARQEGDRAHAPPREAAPPPVPRTDLYRGNPRSKVFHRAGCRNYFCRECTEVFLTRGEAILRGYAPARCRNP